MPTSYAISGNVLTQRVEHQGATYPIAADPQFTWGWITGTLYFNRNETNTMMTVSGVAAIFGGICATSLVTGVYAVAVCGGAAAHAGVVAAMANHYYNTNRCLKVKLPTFEPGGVQMGSRNCR